MDRDAELKMVPLNELLTIEQIHETARLINLTPDDQFEQAKTLRKYYRTFSEQLDSKGVLADYLAYVVVFVVGDVMKVVSAMDGLANKEQASRH